MLKVLKFVLICQYAAHAAWSNANDQQQQQQLLESDSRYISYKDLMEYAKQFEDDNTTSYAQMLFDVARNQVIVGARDALFRLNFDLELLEKSVWEALPHETALCQVKGQAEHLCRNYVRVLHSYGENLLYACGTYAFNPNCSWRQMDNLTVTGFDSGVAKCPFNPKSNSTSLMTSAGRMFMGTDTDFSGSDAAILATTVQPKKQFRLDSEMQIIRTKQYDGYWLNIPQFVGSFEAGPFVYFLFREPAVEFINYGKVIYTRVGRVCKNDYGGDKILKNNWTTFLKARLNCSLPGDYPFYFNEIQSMVYSEDQNVVYATFSTPNNNIFGSAICAYNVSTINEAFEENFLYQEHTDSAWRSVKSAHRNHFRCEDPPPNLRRKHLLESSRYQLMENVVQPITEATLYYANMEQFTHISLDALNNGKEEIQVLFVATADNLIKKLSLKFQFDEEGSISSQTCLVEVWQMAGSILYMSHLKVKNALYIGLEHYAARLPVQHCKRHVSQLSCLNAMDPYCGWHELTEKCIPQDEALPVNQYWLQLPNLTCPKLSQPNDGGWSSWSEWFVCQQHGEDMGNCLCRSRDCNNPLPQNGGKQCIGVKTQVTNCTIHGGWTEWSPWSACSQPCGMAVQYRRRHCSNPKPAFGGLTCVGSEHIENYCTHLPPCPAPKPTVIDGSWGPWGSWGECTVPCGGGFRLRRRDCDDPLPQNGGAECAGCNIDYESCNEHACEEVRKTSIWTPWLLSNKPNETDVERRFRFSCRAATSDPTSLHLTLAKEETRICHADGSCQRTTDGSSEDHHTTYKHANQELQHHLNKIVCANGHEWSCWQDWSACSVSCGVGIRRRIRKCLQRYCTGPAVEETSCEMVPCADVAGWSDWSTWTDCSTDGLRFRYRKCLIETPNSSECVGQEFEKTACAPDACQGNVAMASTTRVVSILVAVIVFIYSISIYLTIVFTKRKLRNKHSSLRNNTVTTTFTSYPNQYSSLRTKDMYEPRTKVKRQSSFNASSSTKNSNINNIMPNHTPKVLAKTFNNCEMATIKRNSNTLNNYRASIEDDQF